MRTPSRRRRIHPRTLVFLVATTSVAAQSRGPAAPNDTARRVVVTGRVMDEQGRAIAGACILASSLRACTTDLALREPTQKADAQGRFAVTLTWSEPLAWDDGPVVIAVTAGRAATCRAMDLLADRFGPWNDKPLDLGDLVLPPAITLTGCVVNAAGEPIAGARVTADDLLQALAFGWTRWQNGPITSQAITGADGKFALPGVSPQGVSLRVKARGFYDTELPFVDTRAATQVHLREGGSITGRVRNTLGQPIRARVLVHYEASTDSSMEATAQDGSFAVNLAHPLGYSVSAHAWSAPISVGGDSHRGVGPASNVTLHVGAAPGKRSLRVHIVDAGNGRAVEDVMAATIWQDNAQDPRMRKWAFMARAVSARVPGELELPGPAPNAPTAGIVVIRARGYAECVVDVEWSDANPVTVEAKMIAESVIAGTVVDAATGQPVAGAAVLVDADQEGDWSALMDATSSPAGAQRTDAAGRFRIRGLAAGEHTLLARHPALPDSAKVSVGVAAGAAKAGVKLEFAVHFSLRGQLAGATCPAGAVVRVRPSDFKDTQSDPTEARLRTRHALIAGDGSFTATGLGRGRHTVEVRWPVQGGRGGAFPLPVGAIVIDQADVEQTFDLAAVVPGQVRGKVSQPGARIPNERVAIVVGAGDQTGSSGFEAQLAATLVAADGSFDLLVPAGTHRLTAVDASTRVPLRTHKVTITSGQVLPLDFDLQLVATHVVLKPEVKDTPVVGGRLEVDLQSDKVGSSMFSWFNGMGVSLTDGRREVDLVLPAQPLKLLVRRNPLPIDSEEAGLDMPPLARHEFTPKVGEPARVEIVVPARVDRPDIDKPARAEPVKPSGGK